MLCAAALVCASAAVTGARAVGAGAAAPSTFRVVAGAASSGVACTTSSRCVTVGTTTMASADGGVHWSPATTPIRAGDPHGVACAGTSVCIAVGQRESGQTAIWRSTNAGAAWSRVAVASVGTLNAVACVSATLCVARAANGTRIVSTNAGATWSISNAAVEPVWCDAPTAQHCVGSGAGGLAYSADGGTTWHSAAIPAGASARTLPACADTACVVFAFDGGDGTLRSTDRGVSYTFIANGIDPGVEAIICQSAIRCVAAGQNIDDAGEFTQATTDGGATWGPDEIGHGPVGAAIACNATRCIEATGDEITIAAYDFFGPIATTTDLGVHWTTRFPSAVSSSAGVACPTTTRCVQTGLEGESFSIDGGATWHAASTGSLALGDGSGFAIGCATATTCFDVTVDDATLEATINVTTDGGVTWAASRSLADLVSAFACPSSTHCLEIGNFEQYDWTPNSGWSANGRSVPFDFVLGADRVVCGATSRCYAIGESGRRDRYRPWVTTDEGKSWHRTPGVPAIAVQRVACVDAMHCVVAGSRFARTTDGGTTWSTISTPPIGAITALTCNAAGRCLAASNSGILESSDGGVTWTRDRAPEVSTVGATDARCRGSFCVVVGQVTLRTP
jgi:hypothetical protein